MIITESEVDSKSNPPSDLTDTGSQSVEPSPPAYQSVPGPSTPVLLTASPELSHMRPSIDDKSREPAWKRFLKALSIAIIIYLFLGTLAKSLFHLADRYLDERVADGPYESDGHVIRCANDTSDPEMDRQQQSPAFFPPVPPPPYASKISFSIPVSSSLIFLLSRGSYDYGSSIRLELSDKTGDDVEIEVIMSYHNNDARRSAKVCLLERDEGGRGVGFFTPRSFLPDFPNHIRQIRFATTVRFPRSGTSQYPLVVNALQTNMGSWTHRIASLEDQIVFNSLSFHASNSLMRAESVSAIAARLRTSNAPITGSYNVSDSLVLTTSNAPITANVRLENEDGHKPTWLEMRTSNGHIKTSVTLASTHTSVSYPAAFSVTARTSNSPLDITFPDAPSSPFCRLDYTGRTSNSPANVKLHASYEGYISLKTSSVFTSRMMWGTVTQDPSGQGRQRTVDIRKIVRGSLEAGVWWGNDSNKDEGKGKVVVVTSNSNNLVELT